MSSVGREGIGFRTEEVGATMEWVLAWLHEGESLMSELVIYKLGAEQQQWK